ncbi:MAG: phospho-N-acetylmuramoyl-pentapeptide-transferase [Candidatus Melainabacteria bacterium]|nr:phospho-N-acetylmuramoyl-pentapeptide-transferase [Candidatus Melainabacteria bacterium]
MHYLLLLLISASTALLLGNPLIQILKAIGIRQTIREDGPPDHIKKKSKVPTIGGLIFLIPVFFLTIVLYLLKKDFQTRDIAIVLAITFTMATLGFIDDYLKILKKHNKGISGWTKLFVQFLASLIISHIYNEHAGLLYLLLNFFIIAGATNSYNLTDGLDGLLSSISLASFLGFLVLFNFHNKIELSYFAAIFLGALLGFLYFNKHPAKVFMGDTGSLAIGGAIGALAIVSKSELYLACFATIPIIEALSVILQVISYQFSKRFLQKDKRIFKMAPIHHHFELCGWKEPVIVRRFFISQVVCVLIGIGILLASLQR